MRKSIILLAISLLFIISLTGCGAKTANDSLVQEDVQKQESSQPAAKKKVVALVVKTLTNPFFVAMEKGARTAETELGI